MILPTTLQQIEHSWTQTVSPWWEHYKSFRVWRKAESQQPKSKAARSEAAGPPTAQPCPQISCTNTAVCRTRAGQEVLCWGHQAGTLSLCPTAGRAAEICKTGKKSVGFYWGGHCNITINPILQEFIRSSAPEGCCSSSPTPFSTRGAHPLAATILHHPTATPLLSITKKGEKLDC